MAYVYYADDGSIQGFSQERSDIPLGPHCTPIPQEAFEMLSAIPTGFKIDLQTGTLKAHSVSDREDWIRWIPVVLNHRYIDGEFVPLLREPTPLEEWMRGYVTGAEKRE
ncbi:MAG: hypothetical protein U9R33_04465 [candidate division NC10 bacterium]|nr:hypothetical protein [candidate division NC10 bacterium]